MLVNINHALLPPRSQAKITKSFMERLKSTEGQKLIRAYGKAEYGEAMYNDAACPTCY